MAAYNVKTVNVTYAYNRIIGH